MASSGSPTVRRRRLAAELKRLRGGLKGGQVARGVEWSPSKVSRAESGRDSIPPAEVEKLIDFYGVTEPLRSRLLELAEDATKRGWWDDYADVLTHDFMEFIGLEAEATSTRQWQSDVIPGLLQTAEYSRKLDAAFRQINPMTPPTVRERLLRVRALRQERLTSEPSLRLSVVMDEAVLLRGIGDRDVMRPQLERLVEAAEFPNVDIQVLPLARNSGLVAASFAILSFGSGGAPDAQSLGDVVSAESLTTELYVEGESGTHLYQLLFQALSRNALPPAESMDLMFGTLKRVWS